MNRPPVYFLVLSLFSFLCVQGITQTSPNLVINPNCALPFSTGWVGAADWNCDGPYIYPYAESSDSLAEQTVDVTPYTQFISGGNVNLVFSVAIWTIVDQVSLYVMFLDINQNYITNWYQNGIASYETWNTFTLSGLVPYNTHYVQIQLVCRYLSGSGNCNTWFEAVSLTLTASVSSSILIGTQSINGGRGNYFQQSTNTLYFVENNSGFFSSYTATRNLNTIAFNSTRTLAQGASLNLVTGTGTSGGQITLDLYNVNTGLNSGPLNLRPLGACQFSLLGYVAFASISTAYVQNLLYAYEYIPFSLLQPNFVFVVWNPTKTAGTPFDYAKILVTAVTTSPPTVTLLVTTYNLVGSAAYQVLGYGYLAPQDVKLTTDGKTAYITEGAGNLLKVDLTAANKNRTAASLIASGLGNLRELQLDQNHHVAYTIAYAAPGTLWSVDLITGASNAILPLYYAAGLLLDTAVAYAYVSEAPYPSYYYYVSKVNLVTTTKSAFAPSYSSIYSLTWTDASQASIIVSCPSYDEIFLLSISQSPAVSTAILSTYPPPFSVAVTAPGQLLVVEDTQIIQYSLSDANFNYLGPTLLGIGFVPVTAITGGYATTASSYFFYVQNSPFGGTLPIMVNHDKARSLGAVYYQVLYDGIAQTNPWNDYKWDPIQNTFVIATTYADSSSRFPVRSVGAVWYNYWLGYFLDTTVYSDNQYHTITVQLFDTYGTIISSGTTSVSIFVDNNWPHANILGIYYTEANGTVIQVSTCAIVQGTSDQFSFLIDASDQLGQDLLSWSLVAYWGANQAASVASDTYSSHSSLVKWVGPYYSTVPTSAWHATVTGDPTSRACAHTFSLGVWDRSINGWGYLHYSSYQVSLTILLS